MTSFSNLSVDRGVVVAVMMDPSVMVMKAWRMCCCGNRLMQWKRNCEIDLFNDQISTNATELKLALLLFI